MARMIPPICEGSTSPGEPLVFAALKDLAPADWTILYSLDIAPWNRNKQTEIDFLLIIPDQGLLCVEVKGHRRIEFIEGVWHLGAEERNRRGPFKQADDAKFALSRRIDAKLPQFTHVPIHRCVVFPLATFDLPEHITAYPWEFLDQTGFESHLDQRTLVGFLQSCLKNWIVEDPRKRLNTKLSEVQVETLVNYLRPTIRNEPSSKKQQEAARLELEQKLRVQQKPVLNLISDNARILVDGGAGTGKTLIAMELARRLTSTHKRVGLFCHQALVGGWIEKQIGSCPGLVKGRFADRLQEMLDLTPPDSAGTTSAWIEKELPEKVLARLDESGQGEEYLFDALVIDEAQDIISRPVWYQLLDRLIRGGLRDGTWALLGDFKYQVLLDDSGQQLLKETLARLAGKCRPVIWRLRENCRNKAFIGNAARSLARPEGWEAIYDGFLREPGHAQDFRKQVYTSNEDQARKLAAEIDYWRTQGYDWNNITILSGKPDGGIAAWIKALPTPGPLAELKTRLRPLLEHEHGLRFGHVDDFKGMENKVIILTDVDLASESDHPQLRKNLFYTGMTRSWDGVSVLWTNRTTDWILRNII